MDRGELRRQVGRGGAMNAATIRLDLLNPRLRVVEGDSVGNVATKNDKERWEVPAKRWPSWEASEPAAHKFERATVALITQGREELTEAERLGLDVATDLLMMFQHPDGTTPESVIRLRAAHEALSGEIPEWQMRARCVQWVAHAGLNGITVEELIRYLEVNDKRFGALRDDVASVRRRMGAFDASPAGKSGARGPERVLAEIIALDLDFEGALGLSAHEGESDADAVERIRTALSKATHQFFTAPKPAKNKP